MANLDNTPNITIYENPGDYIVDALISPLDVGEIKVDKTIHVNWDGVSKLTFALYHQSDPPEGDWESESIGTKENIKKSLTDIAALITDIAGKKYKNKEDEQSCLENMNGVGKDLFDRLIPEELGSRVKKWQSGEILCISTNEQWIPWELIYDGNGFWGDRFLLFRIPRLRNSSGLNNQKSGISRRQFSSDKIVKVVHVVGGKIDDAYAEKAKSAFLLLIEQASVVTLENKSLSSLMKQTDNADLLHFTCHGHTDPLYIQISDKEDKQLNLLITSLKNENFLLKNGCIVFSNACNSAAPTVIFGDFVSFGWEFYRKGAAIFVGTIGTIPTEYAIEFSLNFYKRLFENKASIGKAFWEAKQEMNNKSNFFHLLYCLYGNPICFKNV
jgi:hypothetical protein